jgi:tetratricopeptide (TPR) repeat protein
MDEMKPLIGKRIAFAGEFSSWNHDEACDIARAHGARCSKDVSPSTTTLVVGSDMWPLRPEGRQTKNLRRAQQLKRDGVPIQIVAETDFCDWVSQPGPGSVCRAKSQADALRYTGATWRQLTAWESCGLVRQKGSSCRPFDFRFLAQVRRLVRLSRQGLSWKKLTLGIQRLRHRLPDVEKAIATLQPYGDEWALRAASGQLIALSGQMLLDFDRMETETVILSSSPDEDLFEAGVKAEACGDFGAAIDAYERLLQAGGRDPDVCFNLANALVQAGRLGSAAIHYAEAVRLDPGYVEAWNNLGHTFRRLGELEAAARSFRRAIDVDASFADAHYSLAATLDDLGKNGDAAAHFKAYLAFDETSKYAQHARSRLVRRPRRAGLKEKPRR